MDAKGYKSMEDHVSDGAGVAGARGLEEELGVGEIQCFGCWKKKLRWYVDITLLPSSTEGVFGHVIDFNREMDEKFGNQMSGW